MNGNVLLDYSMDQTTYFPTLDQYKLSPAIAVGAVEGAPVVAAVNGTGLFYRAECADGYYTDNGTWKWISGCLWTAYRSDSSQKEIQLKRERR